MKFHISDSHYLYFTIPFLYYIQNSQTENNSQWIPIFIDEKNKIIIRVFQLYKELSVRITLTIVLLEIILFKSTETWF